MSQFCILVTGRLPGFGFGLHPLHVFHPRRPEANLTDGGAANAAVKPSTLVDAFVSFTERNPTSESRVP